MSSLSAPVTKDRKNLLLFVMGGLLIVLGLAFFVSPLASTSPDGLQKVAENQGFAGSARDHALADAPLAGYGGDEVSKGVAGVIGVVVTFGVAMVVFGLIRVSAGRKRGAADGEAPTAT